MKIRRYPRPDTPYGSLICAQRRAACLLYTSGEFSLREVCMLLGRGETFVKSAVRQGRARENRPGPSRA